MRCRQGDIAYVVGAGTPGLNGCMVVCVRLADPESYWPTAPGPTWTIRSVAKGRPLPCMNPFGGVFFSEERPLADSCLRPIRDPGDDAVDETLLRLPSPRQEVTA